MKLNTAKIRVRTNLMQFSVTAEPGFHAMVVVSKKNYKKAHDRNSVRRRIYAALRRERWDELLANHALQIRLHKTGILEYTYSELQKELLDGLQKLEQRINRTAK